MILSHYSLITHSNLAATTILNQLIINFYFIFYSQKLYKQIDWTKFKSEDDEDEE